MDQKQLFETEKLIAESSDKVVSLTNYRIVYDTQSFGKAHYISIHLQDISAIEVNYRSFLIFILIGVLGIVGAVLFGVNNQGDLFAVCGIIGIVSFILYFVTRKHIVSIVSSGGTKLNFYTRGMKKEDLFDFIKKIENAKNLRMLLTNS